MSNSLELKVKQIVYHEKGNLLLVVDDPTYYSLLTERLLKLNRIMSIVIFSDPSSYKRNFYGSNVVTSLNTIVFDSISKTGNTGLDRGKLTCNRVISDEDLFVEFIDLMRDRGLKMKIVDLAYIYNALFEVLNNNKLNDCENYLMEIAHTADPRLVKNAITWYIDYMILKDFIDPNLYPYLIRHNMGGVKQLFDIFTDVAIQDVHIYITKYKDVFELICKKSKSLLMTTNYKNYLAMNNEFSSDIFKNVVLL